MPNPTMIQQIRLFAVIRCLRAAAARIVERPGPIGCGSVELTGQFTLILPKTKSGSCNESNSANPATRPETRMVPRVGTGEVRLGATHRSAGELAQSGASGASDHDQARRAETGAGAARAANSGGARWSRCLSSGMRNASGGLAQRLRWRR